jgi:hypothetical protein
MREQLQAAELNSKPPPLLAGTCANPRMSHTCPTLRPVHALFRLQPLSQQSYLPSPVQIVAMRVVGSSTDPQAYSMDRCAAAAILIESLVWYQRVERFQT